MVDSMNTINLSEIFTDEDKALNFAYSADLLYDGGNCTTPNCNGTYEIANDSSKKFGCKLKCNKCNSTKSILYNSIFYLSHTSIHQILHLIHCWAQECSISFAAYECNVSEATASSFYQSFRKACKHYIDVEGEKQIGGIGLNVELDETLITKRKSNAGRVLKQIWLFGGICRETKERFVIKVPNRSARTLLPLIQAYVEAGSIIHTDHWRAYNGISDLPEGYTHKKVNHSQNFVDPNTGSHTQNVERMWREVKRVKKRYEGINSIDINDHVSEYLWRCRNDVKRKNAFSSALFLIAGCRYLR